MSTSQRWEPYAIKRAYKQGDYVFREGDPGNEMYIISAGKVAISKAVPGGEPLQLGYRGPDELIGEMSLLRDVPRNASGMAIEPVTLLAIAREDFWHLLRTEADFQDTVIQTLMENLMAADIGRVSAAVSEHELFDRLGSLSSEKDRLGELMQLRQETIRFIVHDLRNPLNAVMASLAALTKVLEADPETNVARFLELGQTSAQRILTMVNAMLEVERLDGGDVVLDLAPVDMVKLATDVVERNQALAGVGEVTLTVDVRDDLPSIVADRQRIDRVLTNLADNALKFTPPGGTIRVSFQREGDELVATVNDTGLGIPEDQRERVFDRFAQTEEGRKARGFGLGLAFCRSAVTAHGGRIWAEPGEDGQGTKFVFTLPVDGPE
jgi:signal transduction histidine kinase